MFMALCGFIVGPVTSTCWPRCPCFGRPVPLHGAHVLLGVPIFYEYFHPPCSHEGLQLTLGAAGSRPSWVLSPPGSDNIHRRGGLPAFVGRSCPSALCLSDPGPSSRATVGGVGGPIPRASPRWPRADRTRGPATPARGGEARPVGSHRCQQPVAVPGASACGDSWLFPLFLLLLPGPPACLLQRVEEPSASAGRAPRKSDIIRLSDGAFLKEKWSECASLGWCCLRPWVAAQSVPSVQLDASCPPRVLFSAPGFPGNRYQASGPALPAWAAGGTRAFLFCFPFKNYIDFIV